MSVYLISFSGANFIFKLEGTSPVGEGAYFEVRRVIQINFQNFIMVFFLKYNIFSYITQSY